MDEIYKKVFFKNFVKRFLLENHITKQYYRDYRITHQNRIFFDETPNKKEFEAMLDDMTRTYFSDTTYEIKHIVGHSKFISTWIVSEKNRQFWLKYSYILQDMNNHYNQLENFLIFKFQQQ